MIVEPEPFIRTFELASEAETRNLAERLAASFGPGDLLTLTGDLGSGKSTFARALIRKLAGDPHLEVPSPTYTLVQSYDLPNLRVVHADLYRVSDASELIELGWDETVENALVLVEWAEKAGGALSDNRVDAHFSHVETKTADAKNARRLVLTAYGEMGERLRRAQAIDALLAGVGFTNPDRKPMPADASTRRYERLRQENARAILMIAPRQPDGPPVRLGKSYSQLVHLAESVHAFVGIANGLRAQGFSAPQVYAGDLDEGLLLIEDFGREGVIDENGPIIPRYETAIDCLAALHARVLPDHVPVIGDMLHAIARYDREALIIEAELLLDWYFPAIMRRTPPASVRLGYSDAWIAALQPVLAGERSWTLRDFFSANLMWLPERSGIQRIGLIDFQDCVIGHPAYDLVSLLQDARLDIPEALEFKLLARYLQARREANPAFDVTDFARAYAVLGAQRASKVLGIFVRLDRRDGKSGYLKHLPRVERALRRCLAHPELAALAAWYDKHLPESEA